MINSIIDYLDKTLFKYANKIAFKDNIEEVTFKEVDYFSKQIATSIIRLGYFEKPIFVINDRNVFTPIAFLSVARSGCFYVPIDPNIPQFRINQIFDIVNAGLLIINRNNLPIIESSKYNGKILVLEDLLEGDIDEQQIQETRSRIISTMPLYVIFTSGSSGVPKGVITSHLSVMCYVDAVNEVLELSSEDILANQSPLDYIAAIRDIYLPLKTGATTVIIPTNEFAIPSKLSETLINNNVTTLCWSAAGLELCVKTGLFEGSIPNKINKILFSGSVLSGKSLSVWQRYFPNALFVNQYGPTESTASCTYHVVKEIATEDTILPIGKPYKNYKIILLSEDNKEVKEGVVGEICVSGPCVSLGYFRNESITNTSFIQNPLNTNYREIIYKTGDLGRYNSNGLIEFCGRKDRQVKHMGHRIELEEIEFNARKIDGVDEAVALYDKKKLLLCLFYTGIALEKEIVLTFRKNLPAFMVPRRVFRVNDFPRLPNGKIDIVVTTNKYLKEDMKK